MKGLRFKLRRFRAAQDGATAVHFAVLFALIAIVWLTAVASLTGGTISTY
jgi:Flp pilus assembly pilin Flp